jgi:UDPglucose 6-dehydrogenase
MALVIIGRSYLSLSCSMLSAQHNEIVALDIDPVKIVMLIQKKYIIGDAKLEYFTTIKQIDLPSR